MKNNASIELLRTIVKEAGEPLYTPAQIEYMLTHVGTHDVYGIERQLNNRIDGIFRCEATIKRKVSKNNIGLNASEQSKGRYRLLIRQSELSKLLEILGIQSVTADNLLDAAHKLGYRT